MYYYEISVFGVVSIVIGYVFLLTIILIGVILWRKNVRDALIKFAECSEIITTLVEKHTSKNIQDNMVEFAELKSKQDSMQTHHNFLQSQIDALQSTDIDKLQDSIEMLCGEVKNLHSAISGLKDIGQQVQHDTPISTSTAERDYPAKVKDTQPDFLQQREASIAEKMKLYHEIAKGNHYVKFEKEATHGFALKDIGVSQSRRSYELSEYSCNSDKTNSPMLLIDLGHRNAIIFPYFNRVYSQQKQKFTDDGFHRFFNVTWGGQYPKLIKPAIVKYENGRVIEVIEMGELS